MTDRLNPTGIGDEGLLDRIRRETQHQIDQLGESIAPAAPVLAGGRIIPDLAEHLREVLLDGVPCALTPTEMVELRDVLDALIDQLAAADG